MMLDHLGQTEAARELEGAIEVSLEHEQTVRRLSPDRLTQRGRCVPFSMR